LLLIGIFLYPNSGTSFALREYINLNWFVLSYIGLYLLTPILNSFIEHADRRNFSLFLINFFVFEFVFGFTTEMVPDFNLGYSILSFSGLYLLGRYVSIYKPNWSQLALHKDVLIVFLCVLFVSLLGMLAVLKGGMITIPRIFNYYNPIVVVESLFVLICFTKFDITSKLINKIAQSCFAVFLFHTHPYVSKMYLYPTIRKLYFNGDYLLITGAVLFIYIIATILDQPRLYLWKKIK